MKHRYAKYLHSEKSRFLFVGAFNTGWGILVSYCTYFLLETSLSVFSILVIANILAITSSFITLKTLVFKTKGNWIREYLKSYYVYGFIALVGMFSMIVMVDNLNLNYYLSQLIATLGCAILSYFLNKKYTFKISEL